ncbi:MAG: alpha/beta hydrolase, partial [Gammaproteobacteria bacterium]|nr:alpha/beta hydrolase [Gammaproteobacteria bacterium]
MTGYKFVKPFYLIVLSLFVIQAIHGIDANAQDIAATINGDKTSPSRPLLFWVNNDYNVVNNSGAINTNLVRCPPQSLTEQVCEQWDEIPRVQAGTFITNTSPNNLSRIESERDLEDFQPLLISLPLETDLKGIPQLPENTTVSLRANNLSINLFRGLWNQGNDYLTDQTVMRNQVRVAFDFNGDGSVLSDEFLYAFPLNSNNAQQAEKVLNQQDIDRFFSQGKQAKFIFEGVESSPLSCITTPQDCYLEIAIKRGNQILASERIYLQLYDVKHFYDHYTVGIGQAQNGATVAATATNLHTTTLPHQYINIHSGLDQGFEEDYIMFVHGWRLPFSERIHFAETSFKRLYLSGYRGRFGTYTWPTGFFELPAHIYRDNELVGFLRGNEQNYGDSEAMARAAGVPLTNLLNALNATNNVNIFAHSMGNVVVSEALRNAGSTQIVANYIASQAAEVASAYNQDANWMDYTFDVDPVPILGDIDRDFEQSAQGVLDAWYFSNPGELFSQDTVFDMPPNFYTYDVPDEHGPTIPLLERRTASQAQENWGPNYYHTIGQAAGNIINFYNVADAALDAWRFNQITKPDFLGGPRWNYEHFQQNVEIDLVQNIFRKDPPNTIEWELTTPINTASAEILGHIIPARTDSLGQSAQINTTGISVVGDNFSLRGFIPSDRAFGQSNQGHSAQFYFHFLGRENY